MTPPARQWIGKYEKVRNEPIGSGGFGSVFLAYDHRMERQVAIKTLDAPDDPSLLARFRAEARALAALQHPNIVIIFETGEDQGRQYLVMEYVDGRTLKDLMGDRGAMPMWRKVEIMAQVADALECAHRHNIVHRDVKPANIMVRREDGAVKILDFGIARLARSDTTRTESGLLMGTIPYMAPEQFDEGGGDALCDLWAYGIVYYELLTGRHPFGNQDTKPFAMASRIREQDYEPVGSLVTNCPPALERVVAGLLKKKRDERYQSFADVQFEVQPLLMELKKQHAASLANRAEEQFAAADYDGVTAAIRTILSLDPASAAVAGLRERLQQARRQRDRREQVNSLIQLADSEASQGHLAEAIQALEQAQRVDPSSSNVSTRIESLRAAQKQAELTRRLVAEARRELEASNLTEAFKAATGALSADRQDAEAAALLEQIRGHIEQRERQRNLQRGLNRARGQIAIKSFEEAIVLLTELAGQYPGAPGVDSLLQEARRQKEERDRREKLAAGIVAARGLIRQQALREAVQALEALAAEFPGEKEAGDLLSYAREELAAREAHARAQEIANQSEELARKLQFDAALQLLEQAVQKYPGEECLPRAMRVVLAARAEHERERALEENLARARRMCQQGAFEEGLAMAAALERDYPGRREPAALREEILREQAAVRRRNLESLLAQAASREKAGDLKGALYLLEDGLQRDPQAPELRQALDAIRQRKAAAERQSAVASACAEIDRLLSAHQMPAARDAIERARRAYGQDARFDDLNKKVEQAQLRRNQLSAAEKQMRERNFGLAEENLTQLLRMDAQDETARTMLDSLGQLRAREQRREAGRREAAQLVEAGRFEDAIRTLDGLLIEFTDDGQLKRDRQAAREAAERKARDEGLARARAEAAEGLRNQDFDKVIRQLEALEKEFPGIPQIAYDLRVARAAKQDFERKQALAAGRAEAERLLAAHDFPAAIQCYRMLLAQYPNDLLLAEELRAAQSAKERFERDELAARQELERKQALSAGIDEARRLLAARNFEAAIQRYQALAAQFPNDLLLAEELRSAQAAKERFERDELAARQELERKQALSAGIDEARRLLAARNFEAAIQRYQALAAQFPNDLLLAEERRSAQAAKERFERDELAARQELERKQALKAGLDEARRLLAARNFEAAIQRYQAFVAQFPNDPLLAEELRSAQATKERLESNDLAVKQEAERNQVLRAGLDEARRLLAERSFDAAIHRYLALVAQFPNDPLLAEELRSAQAARERFESNELVARQEFENQKALNAGRDEARQLLAAGNLDAAIQRYQALAGQFPKDPLLAEELRSTQAAKESYDRGTVAARQEYERQRIILAGRAEAERLLAARDFQGAIQRYRTLAAQFPDHALLAEELRSAEAARQRFERGDLTSRLRNEASEALRNQDFEGAIRTLEALESKFPGDPQVGYDLQAARAAKVDAERKQALTDGRAEARRLLADRQFDAAIQRYRSLAAQSPNDPLLAEELRSAEAARQRSESNELAGRARAEAAGWLRNQEFERAIRRLQDLEKQYPDDTQIHYDYEAALTAKDEFDRRQALAAGRADAQRLLAERKFDAAIQRYQLLMVQFSNDPLLPDELREAHLAKSHFEEKEQIARGRGDAAELLRRKEFDRAAGLLESLARKFPGDLGLADDLREARQLKEETLRRQTYQRGLTEAEGQVTAGSLDEAIRRYEALLKQYPEDAAVREGLAAAKTAKAAKTAADRKQVYLRALAEAESLVAAGSFDEAIRRCEALVKQYPEESALRDGLAAARSAKVAAGRKQTYLRALAEAEGLVTSGSFDEAIRRYESLLKEHPGDAALRDGLTAAKSAKDEAGRRQVYLRARADAEGLVTTGSFDEAILRYESLLKEHPGDAALRDGLTAAKSAKDEAGRRQAYLRARADAEGLVTAGSFDEAIRRYELLLKEHPGDAALRDGLAGAKAAKADADRKQIYQRGRAEAEGLVTAGSFDEAIRRYEYLLKQHPGDAALRDGLAGAKAAKADADRKQIYQRGRAEAEGLVTAGSFDEAIRRYEYLLKEHPGDAALRDGLAGAKAAKADADRKQIYQRGRAEAGRLSHEANFAAAIRVLEDLVKQFSGDRALLDDLQIARQARDLQEQRIRIDGRIAQLEKLRAKGDAAGVKNEAGRLLAECEEPRARALLEWALAVEAGTAPPPPRKPAWLLASLPAVAVVVFGVIWWATHRPPPPAALDAQPQKLSFTWKQGDRLPDSQKITIRAKGGAAHWTGTSEDGWLITEPVGSSQINVSINTAKVDKTGPAEYSGLVLISGGGIDRRVNVTLSVRAEAKVEESTAKPALEVTPAELFFSWKAPAPLPDRKIVSIQSHGGMVDWKVTPTNLLWLSVSLSKDQTQLAVSVNPTHVNGHHTALLQVSSGDATRVVQVDLTVESPEIPVALSGDHASTGKTIVIPPPPPPAKVEPPVKAAVDCHGPEYTATRPDNGKLQWTGQLAPGATLWLSGDLSWKDPAGPAGGWKGRYSLPGCPVEIQTTPNLPMDEPASPGNNFSRLRLKNNTGAPVTSITLQWTVK